jgi:hypothetical protein
MQRLVLTPLLLFVSCASLHSYQVGEIDSSRGNLVPVELKQNSLGVNVSDATGIAKALTTNRDVRKGADTVNDVWKFLTFGPKTGEVTFTDSYADEGLAGLLALCPTKRLTGINVIRETNKYPVISGEIVRLRAFCVHTQSEKTP